ncbi:23S rRNA (pseudouridine(1915)-N(3))-methyltransferase RlmH [Trichlorobacter sp.]|uniref:23S rRNA (pseudouridine(1915)-N(3))-methyltransferase RlmH n=1 Tax=Trichlorobacter sp. TaxID=2911007 RepID=UPI002A361577|nr:23S rRNA (pseudouridine(1915)-N(3))-methyltransferase RlmH [Trichlorobacter sp.]MDY0385054.1 23S rRNA (pseudouridine(1915)-N(3))-methyltransferase RlmH [Trichlorobacter sp.]
MKLRVLWLGKTRDAWIKNGVTEYATRVGRYLPLTFDELKDEKDATQQEGRRREGERLLKQLSPQTVLVVLDERGQQMTSVQFAEFIGKQRDNGTAELAFAIGGAYGFSDEVRNRAARVLALSAMTFTHQMVRPFLLEQMYRACTILNNEPYHH